MTHLTYHGCPNWTSAGCACTEPASSALVLPEDRFPGVITIKKALLAEAYRGLKRNYEMLEVRKEIDRLLAAAPASGPVHLIRVTGGPIPASGQSDDELQAVLFAYEGALSESDQDGDDSQTQDARDRLLDVLRRLRDAAQRPASGPSEEAVILAKDYVDDHSNIGLFARELLRLAGEKP